MSNEHHEHYIVVRDPYERSEDAAERSAAYWEGSVVDPERARLLRARGVDLLPCDPTLFICGAGGFAKRAWGGGWPIDFGAPRYVCPLTMLVFKDPSSFVPGWRPTDTLHWMARLLIAEDLEERARGGERFEGLVRFAADSTQPLPAFATYAAAEGPVNTATLGRPDAEGGWTIGGKGRVNVPQDGHYGFALYGAAPGLRVAWAAASLAHA